MKLCSKNRLNRRSGAYTNSIHKLVIRAPTRGDLMDLEYRGPAILKKF